MFKDLSGLDNKSQVLLDSLIPFYEKQKNKKILCDIISGVSPISLRLLDWFVSNYSKKNDVTYELKSGVSFNVFFQYKARLKSFSKKLFDPFRRGEKITLQCSKDDISTTVGQLNFFKWCIEQDILKWVKENLVEIEKDMTEVQNNKNISEKLGKTQHKAQNTECKPKRQQLSKSILKTMNKKNTNVIVDFN